VRAKLEHMWRGSESVDDLRAAPADTAFRRRSPVLLANVDELENAAGSSSWKRLRQPSPAYGLVLIEQPPGGQPELLMRHQLAPQQTLFDSRGVLA
jgi:hypothetical protein